MDKPKESIMSQLEPLINKIGELTKVQRYLIYCGTILVVIAVYVYFFYMPNQKEINRLDKEYTKLAQELQTTKKKANQLKKYQKKIEDAKVQFQIVKKTLPEKKDIPALLTSISQAGRDAGMEFVLFQPKGEVNKKFYAEIPVSINVSGSYHNLALFFDRVANLSRIVNVRDINLRSGSGKDGTLNTTCTAVTYRFIEG